MNLFYLRTEMSDKEQEEQTEKKEYKLFSDFPISKRTLEGLTKHEFTKPTKVQRLSLPWSLEGRDVVAGAKTGSGKTLALIIPVCELNIF